MNVEVERGSQRPRGTLEPVTDAAGRRYWLAR